MHTHSQKSHCSPERYSRSAPLSRSRPTRKSAFVPQIIGIPYFDAMKAGGRGSCRQVRRRFHLSGPGRHQPCRSDADRPESDRPGRQRRRRLGARRFQYCAGRRGREGETHRAVHLGQRRAEVRPRVICRAGDGRGFGRRDHRRDAVKRVGEDAKIGIVSGEATASNLNAWIGLHAGEDQRRNILLKLLEPQFAGGFPPSALRRSRPTSLDGQSRPQGPDRRGHLHHMPGRRTGHRDGGQDRQGDRNGLLLVAEHCARLPQERFFRLQRALGLTKELGYLTVYGRASS